MRGPVVGTTTYQASTEMGSSNTSGIIKHNRKCKDVVFLVFFIAFWVAMIVNSSFAFNQGNPLRLNYGLDYEGNVCGDRHAHRNLRELELQYWLNPNQVYQSGLKNSQFKLSNARSVCLLDCPNPSEDSLGWVCDYPDGDIRLSIDDWIDRNYDYFADLTPQLRNSSLQLQGPCYPIVFPSVNGKSRDILFTRSCKIDYVPLVPQLLHSANSSFPLSNTFAASNVFFAFFSFLIPPYDLVYWSCQLIARASNASLRHWREMGGVSIVEDILIDKSIHRSINSHSSVMKRYVADVGKAWPVLIVCGGIVPLFLSVIWLLLIRHFVAGMPWITVILFNVLIITVTMFNYLKGILCAHVFFVFLLLCGTNILRERTRNFIVLLMKMFSMLLSAGWIGNSAISPIIGEHDPYYTVSARELNHIRVAAVLMTVVMIVSILSSIAVVRRILMATSVLKVAAKVIGEVRALIIFPLIPYAILAVFYMIWLSAALHLFSSGQVLQNDCNANCCAYDLKTKRVSCNSCCGYSIHYTSHIAAAILFHLIGCYWATQFFVACSSTVIAGSVASYYWARGARSETPPEVPFLPVFSSMKRLARYSVGSVALGSLIVKFVESTRFILEAIRHRLKVANIIPESWVGKVAFHSSQSCLRCIGWTIKSVNRNAYIMIAITGESFFRASEMSTELIISNILRIGKVNIIGDVILFLGKLCVSLSSVLFAFLMLETHRYRSAHNKISSPLFPVLACWCLGYVVATLFFAVVEMSIDTIILSFCQDSEEHQGTAQFASPLLMETFNDQNEVQRLTQ